MRASVRKVPQKSKLRAQAGAQGEMMNFARSATEIAQAGAKAPQQSSYRCNGGVKAHRPDGDKGGMVNPNRVQVQVCKKNCTFRFFLRRLQERNALDR